MTNHETGGNRFRDTEVEVEVPDLHDQVLSKLAKVVQKRVNEEQPVRKNLLRDMIDSYRRKRREDEAIRSRFSSISYDALWVHNTTELISNFIRTLVARKGSGYVHDRILPDLEVKKGRIDGSLDTYYEIHIFKTLPLKTKPQVVTTVTIGLKSKTPTQEDAQAFFYIAASGEHVAQPINIVKDVSIPAGDNYEAANNVWIQFAVFMNEVVDVLFSELRDED